MQSFKTSTMTDILIWYEKNFIFAKITLFSSLIFFCDLQPKVPSTALSAVSSSAWIHDNASFVVEDLATKTLERISSAQTKPTVISVTEVANRQQPSTSAACDPSSSTAAAAATEKPKGTFRKCRCFLRRLSRTFHRGSTQDDKKK